MVKVMIVSSTLEKRWSDTVFLQGFSVSCFSCYLALGIIDERGEKIRGLGTNADKLSLD